MDLKRFYRMIMQAADTSQLIQRIPANLCCLKGVYEIIRGYNQKDPNSIIMCRMLAMTKQETTDKIVIVSNYTQTLDLIQTFCRKKQ